jgi:hypothetical protein
MLLPRQTPADTRAQSVWDSVQLCLLVLNSEVLPESAERRHVQRHQHEMLIEQLMPCKQTAHIYDSQSTMQH